MPAADKASIKAITEGYGEIPPRFRVWMQWLSIFKYDVAERKFPEDLSIARKFIRFVREL
jgi:hypothetical protein